MRRDDILGWKGLLAAEGSWQRQFIFFVHLAILASMVFLHLGFVPVGGSIPYLCCLLPLVGPVVATSLLLGSRSGCLQGFLAGTFLVLHTIILPGSIAEYLFVTPLGALGFMAAAFLSAVLFARMMDTHTTGDHRKTPLALVSLAASAVVTVLFVVGALLITSPTAVLLSSSPLGTLFNPSPLSSVSIAMPSQYGSLTERIAFLHSIVGSLVAQLLLDALITYGCARIASELARVQQTPRNMLSVRLLFRLQLLSMISLILLIGAASAHVRLTQYCWVHADTKMTEDIERLTTHIENTVAEQETPQDALQAIKALVSMYDLGTDGTVTIYDEKGVIATNNPAHKSEGIDLVDMLQDRPATTQMRITFFDEGVNGHTQQGCYRIANGQGFRVLLIRPYATVFRDRFFTMLSIATTTVILLSLVYVYADRLLVLILAKPIDQTNEALSKITSGNLNEVVNARGSAEFSSLSDGINTTVTALKNYAEETERRMEEDLLTAQHIQQSCLPHLLPKTLTSVPFDIYASMRAAKDVGGDFYDFFLVDDHTLGFLIADVSGKGIPAALFMMEAKNEIATRMQETNNLAAALDAANSTLCVGNEEAMFVTVWAATLDWKTGKLTYVNAGHNPPLLRHNGVWDWMPDDGGPMLGIGDFFSYESHVLHLEKGDELFLYTDGVTEAMNPQNQLFGEKRLLAFLQKHPMLSPHALDDAIKSEVAGWANGANQSDDITLLGLEIISDL